MSLKTQESLIVGDRRISVNQAIAEVEAKSHFLSGGLGDSEDGVTVGPFGTFGSEVSPQPIQKTESIQAHTLEDAYVHPESPVSLSARDSTDSSVSEIEAIPVNVGGDTVVSWLQNSAESMDETHFEITDNLFDSAGGIIGFEQFQEDFPANFDNLEFSQDAMGDAFAMNVDRPCEAQDAQTDEREAAETSFAIRQSTYSSESNRCKYSLC